MYFENDCGRFQNTFSQKGCCRDSLTDRCATVPKGNEQQIQLAVAAPLVKNQIWKIRRFSRFVNI
ncbi:hypothetical protein CGS50_008110 [Faecalibacterium prausnitzii]|uniref:Uncharacterized protein n=1 Tax=Faecalibacterium prausnitzii TaxID=853 RepID=A0A2J4JML6_9FIRM|nr:hypothetical protein CGS50_008110 [Faecalibacterium prausnitzii]